jgi:hypothetical protein
MIKDLIFFMIINGFAGKMDFEQKLSLLFEKHTYAGIVRYIHHQALLAGCFHDFQNK